MARHRWRKKGIVQPTAEAPLEPSSRLIAVDSSQGIVAVAVGLNSRVVNFKTGDVLTPLVNSQHEAAIRVLAIDCKTNSVLTGGDDKTVKLWHLVHRTNLLTTQAPKKVSAATYTSTGAYICFADRFGDILCVNAEKCPADTQQGLPCSLKPSLLLGHFCAIITSVIVSPDNRYIVTTDRDGKVRVSRLPEAPELGSYEVQSYCMGHSAFVSCAAFLVCGETVRLITGGGDGTVRVWDHLTGKLLGTFKASLPDTSPAMGEARSGEELQPAVASTSAAAGGGEADAAGVAPSPCSSSGIHDEGGSEADDEEVEEEEGEGGEEGEVAIGRQLNCAPVLSVAAAPNGRALAVLVEGQHGARLLDVDAGSGAMESSQVVELPGVSHPRQVAFDDDGRLWVVGGPPCHSSEALHVGVAEQGSSGQWEAATDRVLSASCRALLECRDELEEQRLSQDPGCADFSYTGYLKKRVLNPEVVEARKKQRNDRREALRLAVVKAAAAGGGAAAWAAAADQGALAGCGQ